MQNSKGVRHLGVAVSIASRVGEGEDGVVQFLPAIPPTLQSYRLLLLSTLKVYCSYYEIIRIISPRETLVILSSSVTLTLP